MISIIVPTNRIGGLDVLFNSLAQQKYMGFELILVDNIKKYREELVAKKAKTCGFKVTHVEPRDNPFPSVGYCRTMNTGVAYASGEYLLYLCDYCWLSKYCTDAHVDFQQRHGAPLMLDFAYTTLPQLVQPLDYVSTVGTGDFAKFTASQNEATERYVHDLDSGKLDHLMWSIFKKEPTSDAEVWAMPMTHALYKNTAESVHPDYNWCAFKNESFPTELLLQMNGHDEAYDRSHGWQDSEFSNRLKVRGTKWWSGPRSHGEVRCLNPRELITVKLLPNEWQSNKTLCDDTRSADKKLPVNPDFNLRDWRQRVLHNQSQVPPL